jgi:hypothetical protein
MEALGKRRYSSFSFTISALDGGEWSASRPGRALPPGKGLPVPIVQDDGWVSELVWTRARGKILCLCRRSILGRPVVQSMAGHYADWAIPARLLLLYKTSHFISWGLSWSSSVLLSKWSRYCSKSGHHRLLPQPLKFIVRYSAFHLFDAV